MRYQVKKQERSYFCVPACLQAILKSYNLELTQEEIAEQIDCGEKGVLDWKSVEKFLLNCRLKFEFFRYNETPFNEPDFLFSNSLREGKNVLVAYKNSVGNHVCLVEKFSDPNLLIIDPKDSQLYDTNIFSLLEKMFREKSGGFGLVSKLS